MELPIDDPLFARQVDLEIYMVGRGAVRYRSQVAKAKDRGRFSESDPGILLLKHTVEPVADALAKFMEEAASGKPGRRITAAKMLDGMDLKTVAYLTCRQCINFLNDPPKLATAAISIATLIEQESRFAHFASQHPALFDNLLGHLDRLSSDAHRRKALSVMVGKFDVPWDKWTMTQKAHLGVKLIDIFSQVTGYFEFKTIRIGKKVDKRIYATDKVTEWIKARELRGELLLPFLLPTIYPPKPWDDSLVGGGYYSNVMPPLTLVKKQRTKRQRDLLLGQDLSLILSTVNALQETPWRINRQVFDVLTYFWDRGFSVADLPANEDEPIPPKPHDIETNKEARKAWRKLASAAHTRNAKQRSIRLQVLRTIEIARLFADEAAIYFPYQLDFRGRAYAVGTGLNPQGPDYARALLTFANGKPINTEADLRWLKIHGANCFGEDKVSLEDRADWVDRHEEDILLCADDPTARRWWTEADKPWSFLAFCFEYAAFKEHGWGYVSSLPVALDGTCNGLQHFSAMLRDPVGGRAVNLVPTNRPQDIYQAVADVVTEKLLADARKDDDMAWIAQTWLAFGIDRKITKRPVMVLPYGGTRFACLKYVTQAFRDRIGAEPSPFGDDTRKALAYLSGLVWSSIGDVVVAARSAMDWLQKVARVAGNTIDFIKWFTPSGFPVVQDYRDQKFRRVRTVLGDKFVFLSLKEEGNRLDRSKQVTAVSPNFVHSMDAAALMATVRLCRDNGVGNFAMIHDSYGTVAADTEVLAISLRMAFVQMYRRDVLEEFRQSVLEDLPEEARALIPPVPGKGSLDIDQVLESPFFFS